MHDIKYIRDNFDNFKKISNRNNTTKIDDILNLDKKNRLLIQEKETLKNKKRIFRNLKMKKCFKKSKEISAKIKELSEDQLKTKNELDKILSSIPNIPNEDVPIGLMRPRIK